MPAFDVKAGETIDFVVDLGGTISHDEFTWTATISEAQDASASAAKGLDRAFVSRNDFAGVPSRPPLGPWGQLAQALFAANEFAFVD